MREVLYEKQLDPKKRVKIFTIDSESEDKKSKTKIRKSFKYKVDRAGGAKPRTKAPLVFIRKYFDTKRNIESFSFHVKGFFFITQEEELMKVWFNHTLDIMIRWKAKNFSPSKSVSLI
jgi:hypothetical protein